MSDPSISFRASAAAGPSRKLLFAGLFIVLSLCLCYAAARQLHMESGRDHLQAWALDPGHGDADSWDPMIAALNWLQQPQEGTLYHSVFFQQGIKFQYPPTSLLPLALMRAAGVTLSPHLFNVVGWFWILAAAAAMAGFAVILAKRSGVAAEGQASAGVLAAGIAVVATLTFYPMMVSYTIGQVQTWINLLFVCACIAWMFERRALAGALIGAICLLKPQFGLFLVWGLLRKEWRFLLGWAAVVLPLGLASLALFGLANNLDYFSVLQFLSSHGEIYYDNQSVNGLLNRLLFLGDSLELPPHFPPYHPVVYFGTLAAFLVLVAAALFLRGRAPDKGGLFDFLTAALTFTIASPVAWTYHYGIALPILAALLFALLQRGSVHPGLWIALGLAYLLTANFFPAANRLAETPLNFLQSYALFGGLLILWLLYRVATPPGFDRRPARLADAKARPGSPVRV